MRQMIPKMKTNGYAMEQMNKKDLSEDAKVGKRHLVITKEQRAGKTLT